MRKLLILISAIVNLYACKAQVNKEIVHPMEPSPYKFLRDNPYVDLPDSLGGETYKGFAFVEGVIVDSTLRITNVKVMKLKLQKTDGEGYIDYYIGIDNEEEVKKMKQFVPFFEEYLNSLKIVRIKGVEPSRNNIITLPIKF